MAELLSDHQVIERVFDHIDNQTTDTSAIVWREPTENYLSTERFQQELTLLRQLPVAFCPSSALPDNGSYVARTAAGVPLLVVRGDDGIVRGFRNACRHRGMQVASGSGCTRVLRCRYHGWTYRLDGRLEHIPHDQGFPELNKSEHSLVPVWVQERHGLVFVNQMQPIAADELDVIPDLLNNDQQVFDSSEKQDDINWKLNVEAAIEGYHIKPTHAETFYPYGFDNLNVVETFGNNSRVTYPFRRIEKLRGVTASERVIDGMVTYVYHLFPNVVVAVLSDHTTVTINEPISPSCTKFVNYRLGMKAKLARAKKDAGFVSDAGGKEDQEVVRAIQAGLTSGANSHFTYGHFEKAIAHFHQNLASALQG